MQVTIIPVAVSVATNVHSPSLLGFLSEFSLNDHKTMDYADRYLQVIYALNNFFLPLFTISPMFTFEAASHLHRYLAIFHCDHDCFLTLVLAWLGLQGLPCYHSKAGILLDYK